MSDDTVYAIAVTLRPGIGLLDEPSLQRKATMRLARQVYEHHVKPTEARDDHLHEALEAGYSLSTYAASIQWSPEDTNTREFLVGLRERIETMQRLYTGDRNGMQVSDEAIDEALGPGWDPQ